MKKRHIINTLLLMGVISTSVLAVNYPPAPLWDRDSAIAAVNSFDVDAAAREIGDISSLYDGPATLDRLHAIETRSDWPLPAREAVIYKFTRSLADLPRDAIATDIMQHLLTYQPRTLVPHEDHSDAAVPLFNIRAAAAGVQNGWQRAESSMEAGTLLQKDPETLVFAYLQTTNRNTRAGYLDALRYASGTDVQAVQSLALRYLPDSPELTQMLGVTAEISADTATVRKLLMHGDGPGLAAILGSVGERLPRPVTARLLTQAIRHAPASNASLAIASWWPLLRHDPETRELMVNTLASPALGSSAALALAQEPDILTIKALQDLAAGDSVAAKRARMALDISGKLLAREMRP